MSPDRTKMVFMEKKGALGNTLWQYDFASGSKQILKELPLSQKYIPIAWSPDQTKIAMSLYRLDATLQEVETVVFDLKSRSAAPFSIIGLQYCGWKKDSQSLFLMDRQQKEYTTQITLYHYDLETGKANIILPKEKLVDIAYNHITDTFLAKKKDNLYVANNPSTDKMKLLLEGVMKVSLSNSGTQIAYINMKDNQLYVLDIATGTKKKLTNFVFKK